MNIEAMETLRLETLRQVEQLALQMVHVAAVPAAVASLATTIPAYLDERLQVDFQRAVRERYLVLTRPGTLDGAPQV